MIVLNGFRSRRPKGRRFPGLRDSGRIRRLKATLAAEIAAANQKGAVTCQLAASPDQFARLLPWLALNRNGLVVFAHPETGNELEDHRDHAIWMGELLPLDLSVLE